MLLVIVGLLQGGCFLLSSGPERPPGFGERDDVDVPDDTQSDSSEPTDVNDESEIQTVNLTGTVTRTAEPQNGGVGTLYIVILERSPIYNPGTEFAGATFVPSADMSDSSASIDYCINDLPIREEPYFVLAFLDDDGNAESYYPMPHHPDLIALEAFAGIDLPRVTLNEPGESQYDIVLNFVFPQL